MDLSRVKDLAKKPAVWAAGGVGVLGAVLLWQSQRTKGGITVNAPAAGDYAGWDSILPGGPGGGGGQPAPDDGTVAPPIDGGVPDPPAPGPPSPPPAPVMGCPAGYELAIWQPDTEYAADYLPGPFPGTICRPVRASGPGTKPAPPAAPVFHPEYWPPADPLITPEPGPAPSVPGPVTTVARTLQSYLTSLADTVAGDQPGRGSGAGWTAQGTHIGKSPSTWMTLRFMDIMPGAYVRYQSDKDLYHWSFSTHKNAETSWNRVMRWTEDILRAHPNLDAGTVLYYQIGRLKRNAIAEGVPLNRLGFQGIEAIPEAHGTAELGI